MYKIDKQQEAAMQHKEPSLELSNDLEGRN